MKDGLKIFGGSVAVYVVMAACAGGSSSAPPSASSSGASGAPAMAGGEMAMLGGSEGMPSSGGASARGGSTQSASAGALAMAGMMNPVPDAGAQEPSGPTVAEEGCTKMGSGVASTYAEHAFPGKTRDELAGIDVLIQNSIVAGYEWQRAASVAIKDGAVAVPCTTRARFILP